MKMLKIKLVAVACLASVSLALAQQPARDQDTIDDIRKAILRLPYYGVFDFLAVHYDKGTATLSGYVYQPLLAREVVATTRRVPRVDEVVDKIERLSLSQHDDDIRWRTFTHIYNDSALSRYAAGGGLTRFDLRYNVARYPGMQPFGYYPIHIIVNRGRTLLLGMVDSEFDKTLAGIRARQVPGTFGVENELVIAGAAVR
jgi:hyperosmotically inducible periplasmic protein